jgi:hypothetical protein
MVSVLLVARVILTLLHTRQEHRAAHDRRIYTKFVASFQFLKPGQTPLDGGSARPARAPAPHARGATREEAGDRDARIGGAAASLLHALGAARLGRELSRWTRIRPHGAAADASDFKSHWACAPSVRQLCATLLRTGLRSKVGVK